MVCRVWELANWQIGTLAHSLALLKNGIDSLSLSALALKVVSLSSTNGLSGVGISTLADWHISTLTTGLLAIAREPVGGRRFKESKS